MEKDSWMQQEFSLNLNRHMKILHIYLQVLYNEIFESKLSENHVDFYEACYICWAD